MSRKGERRFILTQTNRNGEVKGRPRHYAKLATAAARAVQLLISLASPGMLRSWRIWERGCSSAG